MPGPKLKCFKFKGKTKCVRVPKGKPGAKVIRAEVPVLAFPKVGKFGGFREEAAIAKGPKQIGTRTAFVSKERFKKLRKEVGAKRAK